MKYVKKYEDFFNEDFNAGPSPAVEPGTKPSTTPSTTPGKKPNRPNPIRRERISPTPAPAKALKKSTAEDVSNKFIELINKSGDDIKKYIEK